MNPEAAFAVAQSMPFPVLVLGMVAWQRRRPRTGPHAPGVELQLATAAGLLLAWTQLGAMGMLATGTLYGPVLWAWLAAGGAAAGIWSRLAWTPPAGRPGNAESTPGPFPVVQEGRGAATAGWTGVAVCAVGLLALAAVPPWYRDEMVYHLALPQQFVREHAYIRPDDNIFASFPLGWESIVSAAMCLGLENPRTLGVWVTLADALAIAGIAGRLGASSLGRATAAGTFLLIPTVCEFGPSAYVEPWLVLTTLLAVNAALTARSQHRAGASTTCSVLAAGAWAGLAASIKYPGLVVALGVLLLLPRTARSLPALATLALLGSPFYIRNLIERGNPVFPLAWRILQGEGWDGTRAWAYAVTLDNYGLGRELVDYILLIPRLLLTREMRIDFQGSVGPLLAVGLLGLLPVTALTPKIITRRGEIHAEDRNGLWMLTVGWTIWWALTVQQVRFWLVAAALLAVGVGVVAPRLRFALPVWIFAAGWAAQPVVTLWQVQQTTAWWTGSVSREDLLDRLLPESARVYRELPLYVPEGERVWLVWMRAFTWDFPRPYKLDCVFEGWRLEAALDAGNAPADVNYLLINERFFLTGTSADWTPWSTLDEGRTVRLRERWAEWLGDGTVREVTRWDGVALYRLGGPLGDYPPRIERGRREERR